jgi:hypothetical protein
MTPEGRDKIRETFAQSLGQKHGERASYCNEFGRGPHFASTWSS